MADLTVVLPLKDRSIHTLDFLQHSVFPEFDYLALDGSTGSENAEIIAKSRIMNMSAIRSCPDTSYLVFVEKMCNGLRHVETEFVVLVDNDDFVLRRGLMAAISVLRKDKKSIFAGGPVLGFQQSSNNGRCSFPLKRVDTSELDELYGIELINQNRDSYRELWYSVFRLDAYIEIWDKILDLGLTDPYVIEYFVGDYAAILGSYHFTGVPHYIGLENQTQRVIDSFSSEDRFGLATANGWSQLEVADAFLSDLGGIQPSLNSSFSRAALSAGFVTRPLRGFPRRATRQALSSFRILPLALMLKVAESGRSIPLPLHPEP